MSDSDRIFADITEFDRAGGAVSLGDLFVRSPDGGMTIRRAGGADVVLSSDEVACVAALAPFARVTHGTVVNIRVGDPAGTRFADGSASQSGSGDAQ